MTLDTDQVVFTLQEPIALVVVLNLPTLLTERLDHLNQVHGVLTFAKGIRLILQHRP